MTHVQTVLILYGAVCVCATLGYVIVDRLTNAHGHLDRRSRSYIRKPQSHQPG
jgi:hypothetical protein